MKKRLYLVFTLIILTVSLSLYSQQKERFGKKRIGRETLSNDKNDNKSGRLEQLRNSRGDEDPSPIGNGLLFLIGLSSAYLIVDKQRNKKQ